MNTLQKSAFFAFSWTPRNYMPCQGHTISVMENQALYAVLGTVFGGDGINDFGLPDLRGKVIVGQGNSPQFGNFVFSYGGGTTITNLSLQNMPAHTHTADLTLANATTTVKVSDQNGVSKKAASRTGTTLGALVSETDKLYNNATPNINLNIAGNTVTGSVAIEPTGSGKAFTNMPPYMVLNPCILTTGVFPSRN